MEKTLKRTPDKKPVIPSGRSAHQSVKRTQSKKKLWTSLPLGSVLLRSSVPARPTSHPLLAHIPARLPPESCLMTSGPNHPSGSAVVVTGELDLVEEDGRASMRMGCRRLAKKAPVPMLSSKGAAVRRRAPRQRATVAMVLLRGLKNGTAGFFATTKLVL